MPRERVTRSLSDTDPKELHARIRRLERQLADARAEQPEPVTITETVNVVPPAVMTAVAGILEAVTTARDKLAQVAEELDATVGDPTPTRPRSQPTVPRQARQRPALPNPPRTAHMPTGRRTAKERILDTLGWLSSVGIDPVNRTQLAMMTGVSPKSGAYGNNLGALRTAGLIDYPRSGAVSLTSEGRMEARYPQPGEVVALSVLFLEGR